MEGGRRGVTLLPYLVSLLYLILCFVLLCALLFLLFISLLCSFFFMLSSSSSFRISLKRTLLSLSLSPLPSFLSLSLTTGAASVGRGLAAAVSR